MSMLRLISLKDLPGAEGRSDLARSLAAASFLSDDELADVIVEKCAGVGSLELTMFLRAIPDLSARPIALDAAIEMTLSAMRRDGMEAREACEVLASQHPNIAAAVRTAHALAEAMIDTTLLAARESSSRMLDLPYECGPLLASGKPRYQLHQVLGVGSQGVVYLGQDRSLSEPANPAWVAVKHVHSDWSAEEASKARRVVHPNAVRVLDRLPGPAQSWMVVFEYVRGGSLENVRRANPAGISVRRAVEIMVEVARGISAAHAAGLVHRDLKPSNVLLGEDGRARVTDFGISHRVSDLATEERVGSLAFMSPEQFRGAPATVQDDVYALGGMLLWLLTGKSPNGATKQEATKFLAHPQTRSESRFGADSDIDEDLRRICERALSVKPEARHQSADGFASDLQAWLRSEPLAWTSPSFERRIRLGFRRSPKAWSSTVIITVLAMLGAIVAAYRIGHAETLRASAALELAKNEAARQAERIHRADIALGFVKNFFQPNSDDNMSANWIHATTFIETVLGPKLTVDEKENQLLWDQRIFTAQRYLQAAQDAGTREQLEPLLIESCLCVWLLRANKAVDALAHLDIIEPHWAKLLSRDDDWLRHLKIMRKCGEFMCVDPSAPDALARRLSLLREAEAMAGNYDSLARPIKLLLVRLKLNVQDQK